MMMMMMMMMIFSPYTSNFEYRGVCSTTTPNRYLYHHGSKRYMRVELTLMSSRIHSNDEKKKWRTYKTLSVCSIIQMFIRY